ncbi:hypothetical protein D3C75_730680 [compost metagenome]
MWSYHPLKDAQDQILEEVSLLIRQLSRMSLLTEKHLVNEHHQLDGSNRCKASH